MMEALNTRGMRETAREEEEYEYDNII